MASEFIVDVSEGTFEEEVIKSSVPVVVDFWAAWCGPCLRLKPVLEALATEQNGTFKLAKVNLDENTNLAVQYNVKSIPTLLYVKNGEIKDVGIGLESKDRILQRIQAL